MVEHKTVELPEETANYTLVEDRGDRAHMEVASDDLVTPAVVGEAPVVGVGPLPRGGPRATFLLGKNLWTWCRLCHQSLLAAR
ncbi:MAG: hypothetical protein ACJ76N_01735 [Thermoanaerobaculia bacterium]